MSGLASGVRAFRVKKAELEANQGGMRDVFNFQLKDGEEAPVFFLGLFRPPIAKAVIEGMSKAELKEAAEIFRAYPRDLSKRGEKVKKMETLKDALLRRMGEEEPVMFGAHRIAVMPFLMTCACDATSSWPDITDCVGCHQNAIDSKKYPRAQSKCGYTVLDMRRSHTVKKGDQKTFHFCEAQYDIETGESDDDCKWCRKATDDGPTRKARIIGVRKWVVGVQWSTTVIGVNDKLARRCLSCDSGKLKSAGYVCGNTACMDVLRVDSNERKVRCSTCNESNYPIEEVECSKCDNPVRSTIADALVSITRAGSTKDDTTYNLSIESLMQLPESVRQWARTVPWKTDLKPPTTAKQARLLGLSSDPFSKGGSGSDDYDVDEKEEEEDE